MSGPHPHQGGGLLYAGAALGQASVGVVMLHGRGGSAADILSLSRVLELQGVAFVAPEAAGNTWYPRSFMAQWEDNEPWVSSALRVVDDAVRALRSHNIDPARTVVMGFSQGACLTCEYVARNPHQVAAAVALTGGLIGASIQAHHHTGRFAQGTRIYLSTGDPDPHVPVQRVQDTARRLEAMGAAVEVEVFKGRPHTVSQPEAVQARALIASLLTDTQGANA